MGKRSSFEKKDRSFYPTPRAAILPLLPFLTIPTRFIEPCAGDYRLARVLEEFGHECVFASDIEPMDDEVCRRDAMQMDFRQFLPDEIITNCPWDRPILHPMIQHFSDQVPTWLLIDADWAHTRQAAPFMDRCTHIVSIGRVKWQEDSKHSGVDNSAWYRFDAKHTGGPQFFGRTASEVKKAAELSEATVFRGVNFHEEDGSWVATLYAGKEIESLGSFPTAQQAAAACATAAELRFGIA